MKNIDITVILARHGEKSSFNSSRISNPKEVEKIAQEMNLREFREIEIHSTPVERAVHTAVSVQNGFQKQSRIAEIKIQEIASGILSTAVTSVEAIMEETEKSKDLNLISPEIRDQYKKAVENHTDSSWSKEDAGVSAWVGILNEEIDFLRSNGAEEFKKTQLQKNGISILEVVLRICSYLLSIQSTNKFVYSVNHAGFIEPTLAYLLGDQITNSPVKEGLTVFQKMGGAFEPSESVKIILKGEKVIFYLRGKIYQITREKMQKEAEKLESISIANQVIEMRRNK